jgi:hypothetical protein
MAVVFAHHLFCYLPVVAAADVWFALAVVVVKVRLLSILSIDFMARFRSVRAPCVLLFCIAVHASSICVLA